MKRLSPNAYGLRRQLAYEEVAGMLDNSKLFTPLPEYPYTEYKDSFEGSYFDNITERIDLLKDQQQRILDRQMTEAMLRKEATSRGVDINVLRAQTAPTYYDIGDQGRTEESEMMSVMSFGRQREGIEERMRDFEEQEARDREQSRSSVSRIIGGGLNTAFHGLTRQFLGSSGSAPATGSRLERESGVASESIPPVEPRLEGQSGVASETVQPSQQEVQAVGRTRMTSDYSEKDADDLPFARISEFFKSVIRNNEVSERGKEMYSEIEEDRRLSRKPNSQTLELIRSLFKKISRH